ncbi:MAG: DUF2510 domain-containing protein [Gulosibacter sp.]|uniref:DUF2510 domain-containing protein n=1 Tax=Gulosibacter sp. TaxID=2817531 RepID=UPI003F908998
MTETPPAGWYPAPHANNESRYWDGQRWTDPMMPPPPVHPNQFSPDGNTQTLVAPAQGPTPHRSGSNGLAIAALIVGIIAFLLGLVPLLGLLVAVAAIALGIVALVKHQSKPMAIIGVVLGGIALISNLMFMASFTSNDEDEQPVAEPQIVEDQDEVEDTAENVPADEVADEADEVVVEEPEVEEEEPVVSAEAGTIDAPYTQPYTATGPFGGEKYSLTASIFDSNANDLVYEWNMFNSEAPAGYKYVVVEYTMTGIDPDGVEPSLASWDLELATAEGNQYSEEWVVLGDGMSSFSDGPTLYPGSEFTGYGVYIVPESAEEFMVYDNGNYVSF